MFARLPQRAFAGVRALAPRHRRRALGHRLLQRRARLVPLRDGRREFLQRGSKLRPKFGFPRGAFVASRAKTRLERRHLIFQIRRLGNLRVQSTLRGRRRVLQPRVHHRERLDLRGEMPSLLLQRGGVFARFVRIRVEFGDASSATVSLGVARLLRRSRRDPRRLQLRLEFRDATFRILRLARDVRGCVPRLALGGVDGELHLLAEHLEVARDLVVAARQRLANLVASRAFARQRGAHSLRLRRRLVRDGARARHLLLRGGDGAFGVRA